MSTFFTIPVMFLQCLAWNAQGDENIAGFKFEQTVTVHVTHQSKVWVSNIEFNMAPFCYVIEAYDNSYVTFGDVIFSGENRYGIVIVK